MQISILRLVEREFHVFHVHFRMHLSERHISPDGMGGEGNLHLVLRSLPIKNDVIRFYLKHTNCMLNKTIT